MAKNNKLFLIVLPVLIIIAVVILRLSFNTAKLAEEVSGCGCSFAEATGDFDSQEAAASFLDQIINPPLAALPAPKSLPVLGEVSPSDKWIEIDLSEQKLIAWEGGNKFLETLVSAGKWGKTPTGDFNIWVKYKYTKMSGGDKAIHTYYYLPNVPYTMYFYKGFGLHGTYWHNNFGHPMSHGCVNLPTIMAEKLFNWADPPMPAGKNTALADKDNAGTRVVIHE